MQTASHPPSADDLWERRQAGRLLRKLDVFESFAAANAGPPDAVRIACADRYRKLIGVHPASRNVLRGRLANLKPGETVADVIAAVRIDLHENGLAAPVESGP